MRPYCAGAFLFYGHESDAFRRPVFTWYELSKIKIIIYSYCLLSEKAGAKVITSRPLIIAIQPLIGHVCMVQISYRTITYRMKSLQK